jgi:putative peptidoglycan lipid II flippase
MFILARPTVALIYGHGNFQPADTMMTTWALRFYLLGLPFAAIDLLLVFSFYARQDTLTPALIGVGTILVYLLLAAGLLPTLGLFSLMIADSVKHMLHTLLSALILNRQVPGLGREGISRALVRVVAAAAVMGGVAFGALKAVEALMGTVGGLAEVLAVAVPGLSGAGVYLGLVTLLGVDEIRLLWDAVRQRLAPGAGA